MEANEEKITALENKIKELENKIETYEEYIENSKVYINQMEFNVLVHQLLLMILDKLDRNNIRAA